MFKKFFFPLFIVTLFMFGLAEIGRAAPNAITLTVNTTDHYNGNDSVPGDRFCGINNAGALPTCSLGAAIEEANAALLTETVTIKFDIPMSDSGCNSSTGVCTISSIGTTNAYLNNITRPVIIDGFTQPNAVQGDLRNGTPHTLKIVLQGQGNTIGLHFSCTGGSMVQGLVFQSFGTPLRLWGNSCATVTMATTLQHNYFGTNVSGSASSGDGSIFIDSSANATVIRGNLFNSTGGTINIQSPTTFMENLIGVDATGTNALLSNGLSLLISDDHLIENNVFGNIDGRVIDISGGNSAFSSNITISDNLIGTDITGTTRFSTGGGISLANTTGNRIEGNVISGGNAGSFGTGIYVHENASNNVIVGNKIGTDVSGTQDFGNSGGGITIWAPGADNNVIGGITAAERNIISGNSQHQIRIGHGDGNKIIGNYIGTDINGTAAITGSHGIIVGGGSPNNTQIGGTNHTTNTCDKECNLVSGNGGHGIWLDNGVNTTNTAKGNFIGVDINGTTAVGNGQDGLRFETGLSNLTIEGGLSRNVIAGNGGNGLFASGHGNTVIRNQMIGFDATGNNLIPNGTAAGDSAAIWIENGSVTVGGSSSYTNYIAGHDGDGIVVVGSSSNAGTTVSHNVIGRKPDNTSAGNTGSGIVLESASNALVRDNVVANNGDAGIQMGRVGGSSFSSDNTIRNNQVLNNAGDGICIYDYAGNNVIMQNDVQNSGGNGICISAERDNSGNITSIFNADNNKIQYNSVITSGINGILVERGISNTVSANTVSHSVELGISLGYGSMSGSTFDYAPLPNDFGDSDGGDQWSFNPDPNYYQNHPLITRAALDGAGNIVINGTLNSEPYREYIIEFFASVNCNTHGVGEGEIYLGSLWGTYTDGSGDATFNTTLATSVPDGYHVTATAATTDMDAFSPSFQAPIDTSEFSPCEVIMPPPSNVLHVVVLAADTQPNSPLDLTPFYTTTVQGIISATSATKTVVILGDRNGIGDTEIIVAQNGSSSTVAIAPVLGTVSPAGEYNMADGDTLADFLDWATDTYADGGTQIIFSYVGHGGALMPETNFAGLFNPSSGGGSLPGSGSLPFPSWIHTGPAYTDYTSQDIVSMTDLAQALDAATDSGANPIAVMDIAQCFGITIEELAELDAYAETITGAPNYAYLQPDMVGDALAAFDVTDTASDLATTLIDSYHNALPATAHPHMLVAIDSAEIPNIITAWNETALVITSAFIGSPANARTNLINAYNGSLYYDMTICDGDFTLDSPDALVDMYSFASQIDTIFNPGIWATQTMTAIDNAVIATRSQNDSPWFASTVPAWNFSNHGGIGLYAPFVARTYSADPGAHYVDFQLAWYSDDFAEGYAMAHETAWDDVLEAFWDGTALKTAACGPATAPSTQSAELSGAITTPSAGTVQAGSGLFPAITLTTDDTVWNPLVTFTIEQTGTIIYSDTVGVGYLTTGTYNIVAATDWIPVTGTYTLTVAIDSSGLVFETNESNNTLVLSDVVSAAAAPLLDAPDAVTALSGVSVTVPILLDSKSHDISSTVFSIDYDESCLSFDDVDANSDTIPDNLQFNVSPFVFSASASHDSADTDGEIDIIITDFAPPLTAMPDGTLIDVTFTTICSATAGTTTLAAVDFSAVPAPSFGNTAGSSVIGATSSGSVKIWPSLRGDCNNDGATNAGDLSAIGLEVFDGDGNGWLNTPAATFSGSPAGCDANESTQVNAADLSCIGLLIFNGSGACTARSSFAMPQPVLKPALSTITIPITLTTLGHDINSLIFSLDYDETTLQFNPADDDNDGIPDAVTFHPSPFAFQMSAAHDAHDSDGELDILIADPFAPYATLPNGVVVEVTFEVIGAGGSGVVFSAEPAPSAGNTSGADVALAEDGTALNAANVPLSIGLLTTDAQISSPAALLSMLLFTLLATVALFRHKGSVRLH